MSGTIAFIVFLSSVWLFCPFWSALNSLTCAVQRWARACWMRRPSICTVSSSCSSQICWETVGAGSQFRWGSLCWSRWADPVTVTTSHGAASRCRACVTNVVWVQGSEEGYLKKTALRSVVIDARAKWAHEESSSDSEPHTSCNLGTDQLEQVKHCVETTNITVHQEIIIIIFTVPLKIKITCSNRHSCWGESPPHT